MKRSFLRQVSPLLISFVVMAALSLTVRKFERDAPRPFDRLLVEVLPEIPEMADWPDALLERMEAAHAKLQDPKLKRDALVELAELYHANGFASQAESCYLGLESFETENPLWPYLLGILKEDRRDKLEVAKHFERALSLDPTDSLAYLRLGNAYRDGGFFEKAREAYEKRLLGKPGDAWALAALGQLCFLEGKFTEAVDWLLKARESDPSIEAIHEVLPEAYLELGDYDAASAARRFSVGMDLKPAPSDPRISFLKDRCFDANRLIDFARSARLGGEDRRALGYLERVFEFAPDNQAAIAELERIADGLIESSGR